MLPVAGTNLALSHFLVIVGMALVILGVAFYWLPVTRVKMAGAGIGDLGRFDRRRRLAASGLRGRWLLKETHSR